MTARSGRKCSELYQKRGPLGLLLKTLLESSAWSSTIVRLQWKTDAVLKTREQLFSLETGWDTSTKYWRLLNQSDTMSKRLLFRLSPSMPDTAETGCGYLVPTPSTTEAPNKNANTNGSKTTAEVAATDWSPVTLWRTPQAGEGNGGGANADARKDQGHQVYLMDQVASGKTSESGSLNPAWVEWLCGYPTGWTALED